MSKQTKAQQAERAKQVAKLREWIKPGDTVYTVLRHVSRSGMMRHISIIIKTAAGFLHPNYAVGTVLGERVVNSCGSDALVVGGCGMDMGFHVVYSLAYALYGDGYKCLGQDKNGRRLCPSNYHSNYRDTVRCEGIEVDGQRSFCWVPSHLNGDPVPDTWPRVASELYVRGRLLYCIGDGEGKPLVVCPTCKGAGSFPNPDGPERFDLVHTDGYALRQEWL